MMSKKHLSNYREIDSFKSVDFDASVEFYSHKKNGLNLVRVRGDWDETFFSFSFSTPPRDSSGVFHIIEHTVLSGSKNFPIKDPFNVAMAQTSASFLNAMTYSNFTSYPASGKVLHDLEKIFFMYADAVFNPLLKKGAFLQEGIRYTRKNGKIIGFDGVVFNEMSENYNARIEVSSRKKNEILYKGTEFQFESGGDIGYIPLLSYENYKDFYNEFYSFDNCTLLLMGSDECDYFLDILEDNIFCKREKKPVKRAVAVEHKDDDSNVAFFDANDNKYPSFFMLIPLSFTKEDHIISRMLSVLSHALLSSSKSALYKELLKSDSFKDISSCTGLEFKDSSAAFIIGLDDVTINYSSCDELISKCENVVISALEKVKKNKINKSSLLSAIKTLKFENTEGSSFHNIGIRITERLMRNKDNRRQYFDVLDDIEAIEEKFKNEPDCFDKLFDKFIFSSKDKKSFISIGDNNITKKEEEKKKNIIAAIEKSIDEKTLQEDEKIFEEYVKKEDEEDVTKYFSFANADELINYAEYDNLNEYKKDGAISLFKENKNAKLNYFNILFDVSDFQDSDIRLLNLLSQVLSDYAKMDRYDKFFDELDMYANDLSFNCFSYQDVSSKVGVVFRISFKSLSEDIEKAISLIGEYINNFTITQRGLKQVLDQIYSYYNEDAAALASSFSYILSSIPLSASSYYSNMLSGMEFKDNMLSYKRSRLKEYALADKLKDLSREIFTKERCVFHIMAKKFNKNLFEYFLSFLKSGKKAERKLSSSFEKKEIYTYPISGLLSYSSMSFMSERCNSTFDIFSSTIQNTTLWNNIRIKGGAYGAKCEYGYYSGIFNLMSYRDPRFLESFDDFIKSIDIEVTSSLLKAGKDAFFIDLANEPSLERKAWFSVRNYILGVTNELRKERFERALALDLGTAKKDIKRLLEFSRDNIKASVTPFFDKV